MKFQVLLAFVLQACIAAARPTASVKLDQATFTGTSNGIVNEFLGIPYAQPPVGDLRFRLPQALGPYTGRHDASKFGPSCTQLTREVPQVPNVTQGVLDFLNYTLWNESTPDSEDCLSINVLTPNSVVNDKKLPVVVFFHGGSFEMSGSSTYDGSNIIKRSVEKGEPIVYVSLNYRLGGFGFLGGDVVKEAGLGNLGLRDQRLALRWIQKYISAFGGDPNKVTLWGQSGGAVSVAMHMIINGGDTEGLFHAGFMQSGSPIPFGYIDGYHGQRYWNALMDTTPCGAAEDKIDCLRQMPYEDLKAAINDQPNIFSWESIIQAWIPRADGMFLKDAPQHLVLQGSVANIPFVIGNVDDEATLFTFANLNITTTELLGDYAHSNFFPNLTDSERATLLGTHPEDPSVGSPFGTGIENALTPEFKRESAAKGDLVWQAPRRFFLDHVADKQPAWSFLSKRNKHIPYLGSYQGTDIPMVFDKGELQDYLINFVNKHNPNGRDAFDWPQYTIENRSLLTLHDGPDVLVNITRDDYRNATFQYITYLALKYPL
ncbi:hypothetical protein AX17_002931 [Amanita inopinata Kibby_2008]|nr:hypothetical protein AX17_002931 [Amanita inopinata Kibby_2008]